MGLHGLAVDERVRRPGPGHGRAGARPRGDRPRAYAGPYFASAVLAATAIAAGGDRGQRPALAAGDRQRRAEGDARACSIDASPGDRDAIQLRPQSRGGEFVLTGTKRFVPWAHVADRMLVVGADPRATAPDGHHRSSGRPSDAAGVTLDAQRGDRPRPARPPRSTSMRSGRARIVGRPGRSGLGGASARAPAGGGRRGRRDARRRAPVHGDERRVREGTRSVRPADRHVPGDQARLRRDAARGRELPRGDVLRRLGARRRCPGRGAGRRRSPRPTSARPRARCAASSIQVHGGIGFTWEYDLHLYFKRAKTLEALYGDAEHHREQALQAALSPRTVEISGVTSLPAPQ